MQLTKLRVEWLEVGRQVKKADTFKLELSNYLENVRPLQWSSLEEAFVKLLGHLNKTQGDFELLKKILLAMAHSSSMSVDMKRAAGNLVMKRIQVLNHLDGAAKVNFGYYSLVFDLR